MKTKKNASIATATAAAATQLIQLLQRNFESLKDMEFIVTPDGARCYLKPLISASKTPEFVMYPEDYFKAEAAEVAVRYLEDQVEAIDWNFDDSESYSIDNFYQELAIFFLNRSLIYSQYTDETIYNLTNFRCDEANKRDENIIPLNEYYVDKRFCAIFHMVCNDYERAVQCMMNYVRIAHLNNEQFDNAYAPTIRKFPKRVKRYLNIDFKKDRSLVQLARQLLAMQFSDSPISIIADKPSLLQINKTDIAAIPAEFLLEILKPCLVQYN